MRTNALALSALVPLPLGVFGSGRTGARSGVPEGVAEGIPPHGERFSVPAGRGVRGARDSAGAEVLGKLRSAGGAQVIFPGVVLEPEA